MKIDRREFLKTAAVMGMLLPITEVYGSVSQRHVHRGSDACTPDVKYLPVSLKEVPRPKNIGFPVQHLCHGVHRVRIDAAARRLESHGGHPHPGLDRGDHA